MEKTDHDLLVEMNVKMDMVLTKQLNHESRITRLERAMWIAIGSSGFLGAIVSKAI